MLAQKTTFVNITNTCNDNQHKILKKGEFLSIKRTIARNLLLKWLKGYDIIIALINYMHALRVCALGDYYAYFKGKTSRSG